MTFPARFGGQCGLCENRIHEGDPIRPTREGEESSTTFVHDDCSDAEARQSDPLAAEHPVCTTCWLTHPEGACDR